MWEKTHTVFSTLSYFQENLSILSFRNNMGAQLKSSWNNKNKRPSLYFISQQILQNFLHTSISIPPYLHHSPLQSQHIFSHFYFLIKKIVKRSRKKAGVGISFFLYLLFFKKKIYFYFLFFFLIFFQEILGFILFYFEDNV